jgi:transposase-like protein
MPCSGASGNCRGARWRCVPCGRDTGNESSSVRSNALMALAAYDSYLVDSASSHMLVSKIKPCMSKYKQLYRETANGSLYKLSFI